MTTSASSATSRPDWNLLPSTLKLTPRWYEIEKTRTLATRGLTLLGGFSLVKAGFSFSSLPNRLPSFLLLVGVAVASFGVAIRCLTPSLNDPAVAKRLRRQAGRDLETSQDLTFVKFFQKYKELLAKGILQNTDVAPLLERDIEDLDYDTFMTKHAGEDARCKQALINALSGEARWRLGISCRVPQVLNPLRPLDAADTALLQNGSHRNDNANLEVLTAKDWDAFIRNNRCESVTDPRSQEALKTLFIAQSLKGDVRHHGYLQYFPVAAQQSIKMTLALFELDLFAEGKLPFNQLSWCKTWAEIASFLPHVNSSKIEKLKEQLRRYFLTSDVTGLQHESAKEMRETLGITPEMIEAAQGSIEDACMKLDYLGEGGFRAKYGIGILNNGTLQSPQIDRIKKELREKLPNASIVTLRNNILKDLEVLGLLAEILGQRWDSMPSHNLASDEAERLTFLSHCAAVWPPEKVKAKLIEAVESLSIFQILVDFPPDFFPKYLQPTDTRLNGKTFAESAEEAVKKAGSLNTRATTGYVLNNHGLIDFLPDLLKKGLLSFTSPALRQMVQKFLTEKGQELLEYGVEGPELWGRDCSRGNLKRLIEIFKEKAPTFETAYQEANTKVMKARQERDNAKAELGGRSFVSETRRKLSAEMQALDQLHRDAQTFVWSKDREHSDHSFKVARKKDEIEKVQASLLAVHTRAQGLPLLQQRLQQQIEALEKQTPPNRAPLTELTARLRQARIALRAQEAAYREFLEKDPQRVSLQTSIDAGKKTLEESNKAPSKLRVDQLTKEIESVKSLKIYQERYLARFESRPDPHPTAGFMLMLSDNTAEGREHLRKSIAEAPQKIQTLEQQLIQAKQADEPQRIEREALERTVRRTQFDLENYIAGLSRRKELHTAREAVYPLEREQFKLLTEMEVGNAREAELAELRRKASEIGPEIAKCPSEIQRLEQELASHQTQYADLERQRKALVQQQEELKQRISNLSRDFKQKQTEMESDTAPAQFQEAIKKEQEKLDAAYQALVQRSIEELSKILLPTI